MKKITFLALFIFLCTVNNLRAQENFTLRLNTGGATEEYNGVTYVADNYADTGNVLDRPQTGLPEPYQTFRFSRSQQMSYAIPVPDGEYTVNLHFAELWFGATAGGAGGVGSRVFDVTIEGALAEDNLDIFAEVGADAMLVKTHTVTVTGGVLDIDFDSRDAVGGERHPVINAIEILSQNMEQLPMITGFDLYNLGLNEVSFEIEDGERYSNDPFFAELWTVPPKNIRPKTIGNVGSVKFMMSGAEEFELEDSIFPFEVYSPSMYHLEEGFYTLTAIPYSGENLSGIEGEPFTISFEAYDGCQESLEDSYIETFPVDCNGNGGRAVLHSFWGPSVSEIEELGGIWRRDAELGLWVADNLQPGNFIIDIGDDVEYLCNGSLEFTIEEDCPNRGNFALRINTGGSEIDYNGETFITDTYFNFGDTLNRPQTGLPEPYQTFRFSRSQQMSYDIPIPDGEYTVNLHFAELWFGATGGGAGGVGSRVFDVTIEGALAEDNLDIFAEVGADAMLVKTHTVTVTDGVLDIDFDSRDEVGGERHPIINGIEILGQASEPDERPFVTTWKTDNPGTSEDNQITIPTFSGETYNYSVDWGDGTSDSGVVGDITHTYSTPGTYAVSISGDFPRIYFNDFFFTGDNDSQKILSVGQWGDLEWNNMQRAFQGCNNLDVVALDMPNLTNVSSMSQMFEGCTELKGTMAFNDWDVSNVTIMSWTFKNAESFNQDIGSWNVSNLWRAWGMFENASSFNQDIGGWNVSNVTVMTAMFSGAEAFNQNIGDWDVSKVNLMDWMFLNAKAFNGNIKDWDVSGTNNLDSMFSGAENFNQDIGNWDVSGVSYMDDMFFNATTFDQDLGGWDVSGITWNPNASYQGFGGMFINSGLSNENYDKTLIGWSQLPLRVGDISLSAPQNQYCEAEEARQFIIDTYGWTINDAGKTEDCSQTQFRPFITTWKTDNEGFSEDNQITIPTHPDEVYNYTVDWGDGTSNSAVTGDITHTYVTPGTYTISIVGSFPRIYFNDFVLSFDTDLNKIISIDQWGDIEWNSMENAFRECRRLDVVAPDAPNLSNVTSVRGMFRDCTQLIGTNAFNSWDVSSVTNMISMFSRAVAFNQDISDWDVSNVTRMGSMFLNADVFNQDIGDWDVSNVTNMAGMFEEARLFNQDIGDWDVSKVTDMTEMFKLAKLFNSDIGDWNVGNVETLRGTFAGAVAFNQNLNQWDVSNVENMFATFNLASSFDQDLGDWDIRNVSNLGYFLNNTAMSTGNYDNTLSGWANLTGLNSNLNLDAITVSYCNSDNARQKLMEDYGWTINDAGKAADCQSPPNSEFWLEAECANVGGNWSVINSANASGGQYLLPPAGANYNSASTDPNSVVTFDVDVEAGNYKIYAMVSVPSQEDDSFWVRVNGESWLRWNLIPGSADFSWHQIHDRELNTSFLTFDLIDGINTIEIGHREDGAGLDKLYVTRTSNAPTGLGEADETCNLGISGKRAVVETNAAILTPNPVITTTTLSFEKPVELTTIQVFDVTGRLVHSYNGREVADEGSYLLQVNDLESGTYFINSVDVKGIKHQKQMVIKK